MYVWEWQWHHLRPGSVYREAGVSRVCISGLFGALREQRERQMNKKEWRGPLAAARRETHNTLSLTHTVGNTAPRTTADARVRAQRLVCRSPGASLDEGACCCVEVEPSRRLNTASRWHRVVVATSRGAHFLVAIQPPASR